MYNALYSTLASYIAKIKVREHRKGNQEWIVQKHKTKNKQNKKHNQEWIVQKHKTKNKQNKKTQHNMC